MSKEAYLMRFVPSPLWMLVFLLALPAALCAQKAKDSWSNLNGLKAGQGIEVIESNMKSHSGRFVTVTEESRSFQENGSDVSIKREAIFRVSTGSGPRHGEHAVIGLVVGGAIGFGIGAAAGSSHGFFGGFRSRNRWSCWHRDWCFQRGTGRRRDACSHNRLSHNTREAAPDDIALNSATSHSRNEDSMTRKRFCCALLIIV